MRYMKDEFLFLSNGANFRGNDGCVSLYNILAVGHTNLSIYLTLPSPKFWANSLPSFTTWGIVFRPVSKSATIALISAKVYTY
jgi:hypothetical protein